MTCSYSAGYLRALAEEYGLTNPDILISGSGSAGSAAYFVAGQYKEMTDVWVDYISSKKLLNRWRFWRVINIDYLVDVVMKKSAPLNADAVESSKIQYFIPALNYKTGKVRYFTNNDHQDIFEILRATKAMPILYRKRVQLDGKLYCDSRISSSAEDNIAKAIESGATHIIVISNNNPSIATKVIYRLWLILRGPKFNKNYAAQEERDESCNLDHVEILRIRPENLKIRGLNNNKKLLQETVVRGQEDCKNDEQLRTFLHEFYGN